MDNLELILQSIREKAEKEENQILEKSQEEAKTILEGMETKAKKEADKILADAKKEITEADIILLGPQIRYELDNVKKVAGTTPVEAINMMDYGMMNGKKVLEHALSVIG